MVDVRRVLVVEVVPMRNMGMRGVPMMHMPAASAPAAPLDLEILIDRGRVLFGVIHQQLARVFGPLETIYTIVSLCLKMAVCFEMMGLPCLEVAICFEMTIFLCFVHQLSECVHVNVL